MRALFVINERSGRRRKFDVAELIRASCVWPHDVVPSREKSDLDAIVDRAEAEGIDVVYAVGGDGTVHETAKRLIGRKPALGILPIGSGNGFARHLGLPVEPRRSLASCSAGTLVTIDTAEVNGTPFLGIMGIGFDALVAHRFAASHVRGLWTYVQEGARAFRSFESETYELAWNSETLRDEALLVAIANAGQYGNNARVAPLASVRDGLLDVVVVRAPSLLRAPWMIAQLFRGTFHRARGVTNVRAAEITIRRASEGAAHLDGEPVMLPAELRIRVRPQSLRVLVPNASHAL
ncbi:MAG: diacylglycerol kinase family lipid kinase [Acidobacteria bacterium]|nr:diacylglycerol kinase family lipid kinase [Acidobacteriota bacterium]MBV9477891.1 diacylglycerol kinase family lipid kinase [Acidobacteriota bacterium]